MKDSIWIEVDGRMDDECFSLSGVVDVVGPQKKVPKQYAALLLWPRTHSYIIQILRRYFWSFKS